MLAVATRRVNGRRPPPTAPGDAWSPTIGTGNAKLGTIPAWSLPAGATCPGATATCARFCYAKQGHFLYAGPRLAYARNLAALADLPRWERWMSGQVARLNGRLFRIHAAGDFHTAAYVQAWTRLARRYPGTTFAAYTRSWALPALLPALLELAALPNVRLWASVDRDNAAAYVAYPAARVLPAAILLTAPADVAIIGAMPPKVRVLVFRTAGLRWTFAPRLGGRLVCPEQNGHPAYPADPERKPGCATCRWCYDHAPRRLR
jgi:hypothetical protein